MRLFKTIFYPLYILVIIFVLMMAFNIYDTLELFKRWGWFKYFSDLPFMARNMMVFLTLLMAVEIVTENIALLKNSGKTKKLEREVTELKAKLYDKANWEDEEDEEEDDEDDEQ